MSGLGVDLDEEDVEKMLRDADIEYDGSLSLMFGISQIRRLSHDYIMSIRKMKRKSIESYRGTSPLIVAGLGCARYRERTGTRLTQK